VTRTWDERDPNFQELHLSSSDRYQLHLIISSTRNHLSVCNWKV